MLLCCELPSGTHSKSTALINNYTQFDWKSTTYLVVNDNPSVSTATLAARVIRRGFGLVEPSL